MTASIFLTSNMDGLAWLFLGILFVGFGIPLILAVIGFTKWHRQKRKSAKTYFIVATIYVLISLGVCGSLML